MNTIIARRDSVCMGDDCFAPNEAVLEYEDDETLSQFMNRVVSYVPRMRGVVWGVRADNSFIAYIITDENAEAQIELLIPDKKMKKSGITSVFCRYFTEGRHGDGKSPLIDCVREHVRKG